MILSQSNKKIKPALVGDNVLVRIPNVDHGRLAPRNVMANISSVDDEFYKLATKTRTLFVEMSFNWLIIMFL